MTRAALRSLLPLAVEEVAGVAATAAAVLAELHERGEHHGALSADTIVLVEGRVELVGASGRGDARADVAALGRVVSAALAAAPPTGRKVDRRVHDVAAVAARARRAVIEDGPTARDLVTMFVDAVDGARLPRPHLAADESRSPTVAAGVLVAWFAVLLVVVAVLPGMAPSVSPPPVLGGAREVAAWLATREPAAASMGVVRGLVTVLAWYLLATTAAAVAARWFAPGRAALGVVERPVPRRVRGMVHAAFGATLAAGALAVADAPGPDGSGAPTPDGDAAVAPLAEADALVVPAHAEATALTPPAPPSQDIGTSPAERTWTVRPGDHVWAIAEGVLAAAWGRPPTDDEVDPYWRTIVDANRDRFLDRENPDLVFPGQLLRVPPAPRPPEARSR